MRGAGGGRPSKGSAARNRNKPTHETVTLPAEGPSVVPDMPDWLPPDCAQSWAALWTTPEASQWTSADVPAVARMVLMQSDGSVLEDNRLLAELRQLEDRFGLNPYARRNMKWVRADEPEPSAEPKGAPVRRLHAIDATA